MPMPAQSAKPSHQQQVEITVKDKTTDHAETFQCDLQLLRSTMTYFEPLIKKQLQTQQETKGKGSSGKAGPICLKVNCDIPVFKWLLAWTEHSTKPKLSAQNAVSVMLSSNFLGMHELTDIALHYVRDHLAEVLLSGVDMECVPGDLLGRLCAMTTEGSIANCLYALYQKKEDRHPNRSFVSALLRHWAADRLMLMPVPTAAAAPASAAGAGRPSADPFAAAVIAAKETKNAADNGLRWCRVCGVLYDARELSRLLANNGAALSSPMNTKEPLCHGCHTSSVSLANRGIGTLRVGNRGEKLTTHTPSRLLPRAPPASSPSSTSTSALRAALEVPAFTGGSSRQDLLVERWAWRLIGATRFAVCRRCRRLVMLVEVASHSCSSNQLKSEFVPAERFGSAGGSGATDMQHLIRWFDFAGKEGVYTEVGDLKLIVCPSGTTGLMEAETIGAPACSDEVAAAGASGSNGNGGGSDINKPTNGTGAAATDEATAATGDLTQSPLSLQPRRGYLADGGVPRSWREMPNAVTEASAVAPNSAKPILSTRPGCPVDVDIENYHERQFFHAMQQHLSLLLLSEKPSTLAAGSSGVAPASSPAIVRSNSCPKLCSFPYVAPPSAPTSFTASPRQTSLTLAGVSSNPRRAGGGSLVLGSSIAMAKPSLAAKKKRVSATRK